MKEENRIFWKNRESNYVEGTALRFKECRDFDSLKKIKLSKVGANLGLELSVKKIGYTK